MARVLITGSSEGLGLMAGQILVQEGHEVTLHARNEQRAADVEASLPEAAHVLVGDVSSIAGMTSVAAQANEIGRYDAVIHNVGVGYREQAHHETADGLSHVFAINVLAPYLLSALMTPPDRLVYFELRPTSWRQSESLGSSVEDESLERPPGVFGLKALRHRSRLRGRAPMEVGAVERP